MKPPQPVISFALASGENLDVLINNMKKINFITSIVFYRKTDLMVTQVTKRKTDFDSR